MDWEKVLNDVISGLSPECIPIEFVISVKYIDYNGVDHVVHGGDLTRFMGDPHKFQAREAQITLDVGRMRRIMYERVTAFFADLAKQPET
jgi:hypothetical protein